MDEVFVITRNQRRFEAKNYLTFEEANIVLRKMDFFRGRIALSTTGYVIAP